MIKTLVPMSLLVLLLVTSSTARAATRQDRLSDNKEMAEIRKDALTALSAIFDWTSSQEDEASSANREEADLQYRPPRATFDRPSVRERSTCKNFFWKTFSTC